MANVQDVAKFFIDLAQKQEQQQSGDLVTNLRLQKLLYFAQGWHLARHNRPLFDAPIEAWRLGPVVPEVYSVYNVNRANGISCDARTAADAFTADELSLLLDVARKYDDCSTTNLVAQSHAKDGPWAQVACSETIPIQVIQEYFSKQQPLLGFNEILAKQETFTPSRDEDGNAVFPHDFDNDWGDGDGD